jgi:hypothetical protein
MKVAIKFCGGCDPDYDRVEYWAAIRGAAGDKIEWVRLDSDNYDAVLHIRGCNKTCPQDDMPQLDRVVTLTDDSLNAEHVVRLLESYSKTK